MVGGVAARQVSIATAMVAVRLHYHSRSPLCMSLLLSPPQPLPSLSSSQPIIQQGKEVYSQIAYAGKKGL